MSAISETYNCIHNILELENVLPNFLSQQVKPNIVLTSKNSKFELPDELPNNVRPKKTSELHGIKVQCPVFFSEWKYYQY